MHFTLCSSALALVSVLFAAGGALSTPLPRTLRPSIAARTWTSWQITLAKTQCAVGAAGAAGNCASGEYCCDDATGCIAPKDVFHYPGEDPDAWGCSRPCEQFEDYHCPNRRHCCTYDSQCTPDGGCAPFQPFNPVGACHDWEGQKACGTGCCGAGYTCEYSQSTGVRCVLTSTLIASPNAASA